MIRRLLKPWTYIKIDQLSGRWDRSAETLRKQVRRSMRWADIILLTEVASDVRAAATKMKGWSLIRNTMGDLGEVAILVRNKVWGVRKHRTYVLAPDLGPGGRVVAIMALLVHKVTGARFIPSIAHLPATVEAAWSARKNPDFKRAEAHRKAVDRWRRIFKSWRRAFKPHAEMPAADWNLDLLKEWVRNWAEGAWPAMDVPRRKVTPKTGTHGNRLIDWFMCRGMFVVSWRILTQYLKASDHKGYRVKAMVLAS